MLNLLLLLVGFLALGRTFGVRTCFCSTLLSVETLVLEKLVARTAPLTDEPMLETVFMVLLPSLGSAILFSLGASSGGTEIIAMILKKYTSVNLSGGLFLSDLFIVMSLFLVFGIETWLFSMLGFLARVLLVDRLLKGINAAKYCVVITSPAHRDAICDYILGHLERGATVSESFVGAYRGDRKSVLFVALTRRQAAQLKRCAKTLDENIFIIVSHSAEVTGDGFYEAL